jgi:hypothetical protein
MGAKTAGVPVTMRALLQRINRKVAAQGEQLKKTRSSRWRNELGDFFTISTGRNVITARHVNPEKYGRELGVLEPWESVVEE